MAERRYETVLIVHPETGETGAKDIIARLRRMLEEQGATVDQVEEWGIRELAYRVRKQRRGYYVLLEFRSTAKALAEFERNLKLAPEVLRFVSVRQPEKVVRPRARPAECPPEKAPPAEAAAVASSAEGSEGRERP